jgi:hypothetical protein
MAAPAMAKAANIVVKHFLALRMFYPLALSLTNHSPDGLEVA